MVEKEKSLKQKQSFELALNDLEDIANKLEDGEIGLDEAIKEFEKGMKLAKFCHEKLEEAERKIEILQKGENGEITKRSVKIKPGTGEIEEESDLQGSLL